MLDKNGIEIKTGDIVKVEGAYFKCDNAYYYIEQDGTNPTYASEGTSVTMMKICKNGKLSTAKNRTAFFPLLSFCSDQAKNAAADKHNAEHATIEVVYNIDNSQVVALFVEKANKDRETAKYYEVRGYDWEHWQKTYIEDAEYFEKAVERMTSNSEPEESAQHTAQSEKCNSDENLCKTTENVKSENADTDSIAESAEESKEEVAENATTTIYKYGMRLRGFSIGCQPKGVVDRLDDETGKYHDIITYDRPLTDKELKDYELDDLNEPEPVNVSKEEAATPII